jgi:hypothetical protein
MPKYIGQDLSSVGAVQGPIPKDYIRVSWSQAHYLRQRDPSVQIVCYLDTSDRGGPRSYAKRWWCWHAPRATVLRWGTPAMLARAGATIGEQLVSALGD